MTEQTMALRRAFADIERLRYGGYDTSVAGKKVIVKKNKQMSQEKGIYRKIVDCWDADDEFAIRSLFKIERGRDERKRQSDERIARESRIKEKSETIDVALARLQERQIPPDQT
jgi:hypothetical protein